MHIVESNKIQNALLIFIKVESLIQGRKLEKDYEDLVGDSSNINEIVKNTLHAQTRLNLDNKISEISAP